MIPITNKCIEVRLLPSDYAPNKNYADIVGYFGLIVLEYNIDDETLEKLLNNGEVPVLRSCHDLENSGNPDELCDMLEFIINELNSGKVVVDVYGYTDVKNRLIHHVPTSSNHFD